MALAVYAAGTYVVLRRHAQVELEHRLEEDLRRAVRDLELGPAGEARWRHADDYVGGSSAPGRGHWAEVWTPAGDLLLSGTTAEPLALGPPPSAAEAVAAPASLRLGDRRLRVMTRERSIAGGPVVIRVAISEATLHDRERELLFGLGLGFVVVLGLAMAGGRLLAVRALSPLAAMATRARRISAERLSERLDARGAGGELEQLADAFNDTFARLEASFEQLRRFTADASHELRTPLTALRSVGEVGLAPGHSADQYREVVASMLEEADRLTRLVDALLQLSRAEAGRIPLALEALDATELAAWVVAQIAVLAEERGQQLTCTGVVAPVQGDRVVLHMALMNLVDNAIKYGRVGGRVEVQVEADESEVRVAVRDDGPGIAPEHRERVFDRFFRVDRDRGRAPGGAGLGLALARWAAEAHGGRIELQSEVGAGTTFRLVLPRAQRG
ncbi:MAG: ATP-binding protein [Vicinamibacteria bacterium]|nr:ATP-binding protein [Vicinamibacteria bacterium]